MTRAAHVLLVEDEPAIRSGLQDQFGREGYRVEVASDVQGALQALQRPFDLVVLDRRLPDGDGLDVLRHLRMRGDHTPVLVLSARGEADDRVTGLEDGADDYVVKPFSPRVLMARVRAVMRRNAEEAAPAPTNRIERLDGRLVIDADRHVVTVCGDVIDLTVTEFGILAHLAQRPGFVRTRDQIIAAVHGRNVVLSSRTIDVHVTALRKKLADLAGCVETVRGVGYRFAESLVPAE